MHGRGHAACCCCVLTVRGLYIITHGTTSPFSPPRRLSPSAADVSARSNITPERSIPKACSRSPSCSGSGSPSLFSAAAACLPPCPCSEGVGAWLGELARGGGAFSGNGVQGVRQAQAQLPQGPVVAGGGPEAPRLHPLPRPRLLERAPRQSRAPPERQELQAAVDQLPAAGAEARHVLAGGGGDGDEPPRHARQQVVEDRTAPSWEDRQRGQELLELVPQEEGRGQGGGPELARAGGHQLRHRLGGLAVRQARRGAGGAGGLRRLVGAARVVVGRLELPDGPAGGRLQAPRARGAQGDVRGLAGHGHGLPRVWWPGRSSTWSGRCGCGRGGWRGRSRSRSAPVDEPGVVRVRAGGWAVRCRCVRARFRRQRRQLLGVPGALRRRHGSDERHRLLRPALHERLLRAQLGICRLSIGGLVVIGRRRRDLRFF